MQDDLRAVRAQYKEFFDPIIRELKAAGEGPRTLNVMPEGNDRGFESQKFAPLCFNFGFWSANTRDRHRPFVYLWIRIPDPIGSKRVFDHLKRREAAINRDLALRDPSFEVNQWNPTTRSPHPQARHYRFIGMLLEHGTIHDPRERLDEIRDWMLAFYPALKGAMEPHLEEIVHELG